MVGRGELRQLAMLLRVSAKTARLIAEVGPVDSDRVRAVAAQVDAMATELDDISKGGRVVPLIRPASDRDV